VLAQRADDRLQKLAGPHGRQIRQYAQKDSTAGCFYSCAPRKTRLLQLHPLCMSRWSTEWDAAIRLLRQRIEEAKTSKLVHTGVWQPGHPICSIS
jgi:hypothetical protein